MDEYSSAGFSSALTHAVWRAGEEALAIRFKDLISTWTEVLRRGEVGQPAEAIREAVAGQLADEQSDIEARIASIQLAKVQEQPFSLQQQAARLIRSVDHRLSALRDGGGGQPSQFGEREPQHTSLDRARENSAAATSSEKSGMSKDLREKILLLLEEHARTGSPSFKGDKEIAERLGYSVGEIQRQMNILESQGLIKSANSRDGNNARISPQGILRVEELKGPVGAGNLYAESAEPISVRIPPAIEESLELFRRDHPDPGKVAFLMMRFGKTSAHENIVSVIRAALGSQGIAGLRADDKQYHDDLFPNILTYIYGCRFGIAVFERIETEQFNPNVALEVGYMFALRKDVCLLKDRTLTTLHTDLMGKLYREFDPLEPFATIPNELSRWLKDKGLGRSSN